MAFKAGSFNKRIWAVTRTTGFLLNNEASFSDSLEDTKRLLKLVYFLDIYYHLNTLHTSVEGPKENIVTSTNLLHSSKTYFGL